MKSKSWNWTILKSACFLCALAICGPTGGSLTLGQAVLDNPSSQKRGPAAESKSEELAIPTLTERAKEIHFSGTLFDGHNDLPWTMRTAADSNFDKVDIRKSTQFHTDIPRIKEGGLKAQFWSVFVPASTASTGDSFVMTMEQIDLVHDMLKKYPDVFEQAKTAADVRRIVSEGKVASMMGIEGGYSIENQLRQIERFYDRGVRYMTLTHSKTIEWADSATDDPQHEGLTAFGEEVVREMNRVGMLVDLSHVSIETMEDALRVTKAPVIFSHSSARAICDHPRNVPDSVLKKLPDNGGVVMINFMSGYIAPTAELEKDKKARGTIFDVCDHIDHVVKMAGIDHVGIGSDFDGVSSLPIGLDDVSKYPYITQILLDRGYSKEDLHKLLGENVLRVLEEAEKVSKALSEEQE